MKKSPTKRKSIRSRLRKTSSSRSRKIQPTSDWIIYTRPNCPYCKDAKNLLKANKKKFKAINVTSKNREMLIKKSKNYPGVPIIFYKNKFIGGFDELKKKFGSLKK